MLDDLVLAGETVRHGAYLCVRLASGADTRALAAVAIPDLAEKLGLENEFGRPAAPASIASASSAAWCGRGSTPVPR